MNFFSFILIVLLLGVVTFVAGRKIRTLQAKKKATAETEPVPGATPETPPLLAQRFRSWYKQAFAADPPLVAWLNSLNEPTLETFTNEIATFTQEARIDLHWLLDQDLSHHPTTRIQLTAMLAHYCQAWYCAVKAQQEVHVLQTWAEFNRNPNDPAHQPLLQALWVQMAAQNLTPPINGEVLIAARTDQQAYMLQSIRDIAQHEPKRFYELLPAAVAVAHSAPTPSFVNRLEQIAQRLVNIRSAQTVPTAAATLPEETKTVAA